MLANSLIIVDTLEAIARSAVAGESPLCPCEFLKGS